MKKLILVAALISSMGLNAQSFSDYKDYVLDRDCIKVMSRFSDTTLTRHNIYYAQIVRPKSLESGYLFVIVDNKGKDRYVKEMDFIRMFTIPEIIN